VPEFGWALGSTELSYGSRLWFRSLLIEHVEVLQNRSYFA
jgi:hypothetical protein